MNQLFYGSIDITKILEEAKKKHSGFTKAQNGHIYGTIQVWLNEEKDKFGNLISIKIVPSKENKDTEAGFYIGNCKPSEGPRPVNDKDLNNLDVNLDIDERPKYDAAKNNINSADDTGLPF